jgi:hypothetical protein
LWAIFNTLIERHPLSTDLSIHVELAVDRFDRTLQRRDLRVAPRLELGEARLRNAHASRSHFLCHASRLAQLRQRALLGDPRPGTLDLSAALRRESGHDFVQTYNHRYFPFLLDRFFAFGWSCSSCAASRSSAVLISRP